MATHPRWITSTPQERLAERLGDLERSTKAMKRGQVAAAPQRARAVGATVSGVTASSPATAVALASVTVNVPSANSLVLVKYAVDIVGSAAGNLGSVILTEPTDIPLGLSLGDGLYYLAGATSQVLPQTDSNIAYVKRGFLVDAYAGGVSTPTPGDRTYTLRGWKTAGAGSVTFSLNVLMIVVL